jgi:hypothetical protein
MLLKYRAHFTSKLGLGKKLEYEFDVQCSEPNVGHSRPVTFSVRSANIDDIIVHSSTFEMHLKNLDTVLNRLTRAGFTVKVDKCNFCKIEISFLWHVIRQ